MGAARPQTPRRWPRFGGNIGLPAASGRAKIFYRKKLAGLHACISWALFRLFSSVFRFCGPSFVLRSVDRKFTDPPELLIPFFKKLIERDLSQRIEMLQQRRFHRLDGDSLILMRATQRLGNHVIDQPQLQQVAGIQLQGLRGFRARASDASREWPRNLPAR